MPRLDGRGERDLRAIEITTGVAVADQAVALAAVIPNWCPSFSPVTVIDWTTAQQSDEAR